LQDSAEFNDEVRVFENIGPAQQFLVDRYWTTNNDDTFTQHPIKVCFVDIETYSPDAFPVPEIASDTINVITVYDNIQDKFYSWGLGEYKVKDADVEYVNCSSERELLVNFIDYIKSDYPDILSGWNSEFFDIPYLINRINKVVGEEAAAQLSPVSTVYSREMVSQFGKYNVRWHIKGMSCVDYLDVYKKFSLGLRESYKLDSIAEHELGEKKVDYGSTNLASLSVDNWDLFVDYNIQDVRLLVKMEQKLQYLELLRMLAYTGCTQFENAMGTLNVITGASVIQARKVGRIVPTFIKKNDGKKYEGAYVGEPVRGFQDQIVSFDLNSLYPSIMISLNLSPETKMGRFEMTSDDKVIVQKIKGTSNTLTKDNFIKVVRDQDLAITRAKVLFSQSRKGIYPSIVDDFYKERVKVKKKMSTLQRKLSKLDKSKTDEVKLLEDEISRLNTKQFTIKIFINTVYGYFGNKHAPMGDPDISRSITLTGQAIIKESNRILTEYVKSKCNLTDEDLERSPVVIYNDTDSVYITIKHLTKHLGVKFADDKLKITEECKQLTQDIEDHLNGQIVKWGESALNSKDCRFMFKRECICDVGIFLQKKRYILRVLDDEDIPVNKFKYTGVEVVRTTMPKPIKPYVKKIIETMLTSKDYDKTNKVLHETYDIFKDLPLESIAFVMGISEYKTSNNGDSCEGFKTYKGMPIHLKGAYYYNTLLDKLDISGKYETISSGDKVRYFYVKQPNQYGIKTFAYKYYFPSELQESLVPDYEMMFDKIVYSVVERVYEAVNWKPRRPGEIVQTCLFDLFQE